MNNGCGNLLHHSSVNTMLPSLSGHTISFERLYVTDFSLSWFSVWPEWVPRPWHSCEWPAIWRQVSAGKFCVLPLWRRLREDPGFWVHHLYPARWECGLELHCPSLWRWASDQVLQKDSKQNLLPSQASVTKTHKVVQMWEPIHLSL